jgi:hypothetical protein
MRFLRQIQDLNEIDFCTCFVQVLNADRFIIYLSISDFEAFSGFILIEILSDFSVLS